MRRKVFYGFIIAEIAFCLWFYLIQSLFSGIFASAITFPFEQIGWGLRKLSLSGMAGNLLAILLYVAISLIPVLVYVKIYQDKQHCKADLILFFLSVFLFAVLYLMINPGLFYAELPKGGKVVLGGTFYSVLCGYVILRVLKKSMDAKTDGLQKGVQILLYALIVVLVYAIFGGYIGSLPTEIRTLQDANSDSLTSMLPDLFTEGVHDELTVTYIFILLRCIVNIIPLAFDILIVYRTIQFMDAIFADRYSETSVLSCQRIADLCVTALQVTVITGMLFNVLQILFHKSLRQVDTVVYVPILSIIFTVVALLIARYIREDQKLKQDNDLFI